MPDAGPLVDSFLPSRLAKLCHAAGIGSTVVVQASPTVQETLLLYDLARDADVDVAGVVGWVDLEGDVARQLDEIAHPVLVGIRPMIQDLPDDEWILRPSIREGLARLAEAGLVFELLGYTRHLPLAIEALAGLDDLTVVIDHLAKPRYDDLDPVWVASMRELGARPNTYVKISGMATEVEGPVTADRFQRHVDLALEYFTPRRSMIGTDWPVSTLALDHGQACVLADELISGLGEDDQRSLWRDSAVAAYRLDS
jgi:L-fuconolactonase